MSKIKDKVSETEGNVENENPSELESPIIELTPEQLEELLYEASSDNSPINIPELLETEMVLNRTLYLSEEITLDTVQHIIMLIHKFNRDDEGIPPENRTPLLLYLDSGGGEVMKGYSLVSAIESSETPIIGVLQGTCMSMCLTVWLACHVRIASRFSSVMYHTIRAHGGEYETLGELGNRYNFYKSIQDNLDKYILEKTKIPKKKLKKKRKSNLDWYITFEEMTKYKMYDYLID